MYNDWSILCFSAGDNSEKSEDASARLSSCIHKLFACFESLAQRFKTTVSLSKYLNTKSGKAKLQDLEFRCSSPQHLKAIPMW